MISVASILSNYITISETRPSNTIIHIFLFYFDIVLSYFINCNSVGHCPIFKTLWANWHFWNYKKLKRKLDGLFIVYIKSIHTTIRLVLARHVKNNKLSTKRENLVWKIPSSSSILHTVFNKYMASLIYSLVLTFRRHCSISKCHVGNIALKVVWCVTENYRAKLMVYEEKTLENKTLCFNNFVQKQYP